jgi:hypothetical protein
VPWVFVLGVCVRCVVVPWVPVRVVCGCVGVFFTFFGRCTRFFGVFLALWSVFFGVWE